MDWQVIIGISSVVIAICAIVVSIRHGVQTRRHNKLSYKPHLTTWMDSDKDKAFYSVELINNGLGPALIEKFTIKVDGEVMPGKQTEPIEKAMELLLPGLNYEKFYKAFLGKGSSMAAKDKHTIVAIQFSQPYPNHELVEEVFNRADIEIAYKSFYGEPFLLSTEDEKAVETTETLSADE